EGAAAATDEAIRLQPNCYVAHRNMAVILLVHPDRSRRDPHKALVSAQKETSLEPEQPFGWYNLALANYRLGDWAAALDALKKRAVMPGHPNEFDFILQAMIHARLGEKDKAREWYAKAVAAIAKNNWPNWETGVTLISQTLAEAAELLGETPDPRAKAKRNAI